MLLIVIGVRIVIAVVLQISNIDIAGALSPTKKS